MESLILKAKTHLVAFCYDEQMINLYDNYAQSFNEVNEKYELNKGSIFCKRVSIFDGEKYLEKFLACIFLKEKDLDILTASLDRLRTLCIGPNAIALKRYGKKETEEVVIVDDAANPKKSSFRWVSLSFIKPKFISTSEAASISKETFKDVKLNIVTA